MIQSEEQLEAGLVQQLQTLGWRHVTLRSTEDLRSNLKSELEFHNNIALSDKEFLKILNYLEKGNVFDKAETLRSRFALNRDDDTTEYIQFLNSKEWCKNRYQVASQIQNSGKSLNRYDVTLFINGLPLVQIELKRRGMELKEAFNQVNRYQRESFWSSGGLFQYIQVFIISNGINTKYYANNKDQDYKQTFYWSNANNEPITQLEQFTNVFLEKCHLSKMISKYITLHQSDRVLMILRPYQYYAVEAIVDRVQVGRKNGYIWHTTGSGKTLTSFKTAQILIENPKVSKVIFVVDRADLDYQTTKEFNHFSEGSVDGTDNTKALVQQLSSNNRLIVTTIQKLNTAISRDRYSTSLESIKTERVIFIFDECHRSQFGETHRNIVSFFINAQIFGFTGTPIFVENSIGKKTTKDLFTECLHRYLITDAISDENVLRFSVEYWGKLKQKNGQLIDEEVSGIATKEFFENPDRISSIVNWIISNHGRKTRNRQFGAILCVSSVDLLIEYYENFKRKSNEGVHNLKIATIFTYIANEEDTEANGLVGDPSFDLGPDSSDGFRTRDYLARFVEDYNKTYKTNESVKDSKGFYSYYKSLAKRMKSRDKKDFSVDEGLDILIVVNMFLTGFDAKTLNTLYVDKNLKFHGLIQAFSRTNRILGQVKSQGNIVCFRNLKNKTDEAISLFSKKNSNEKILLGPYEDYLADFGGTLERLREIAPNPQSVNQLISEKDRLEFVRAFRSVLRLRNILESFVEFAPSDLTISNQEFEDYKSKYLDIHDQTKKHNSIEKSSIIEEVDFELELIHRDEINVTYILQLLKAMAGSTCLDEDELQSKKSQISEILSSDAKMRSKKFLIEQFIEQHMINSSSSIASSFKGYWLSARSEAIRKICNKENISESSFLDMMARYQFSGKKPLGDEIISALNIKPSILKRKIVIESITNSLTGIVELYDENIGDLETI